MMSERPSTEARERVLRVAEQLFTERGYAAVTMRDIAEALGMRQASLYHHVPGGKEDLYMEVITRTMARHRAGMEAALAAGGDDLRGQLRAAARWLLEQPPVNISRLFRSDVPAIGGRHAEELVYLLKDSLFAPIGRAMTAAYERGEVRLTHAMVSAVSFVAIIDALHEVHRYANVPLAALASDTVDTLLDGLRRR